MQAWTQSRIVIAIHGNIGTVTVNGWLPINSADGYPRDKMDGMAECVHTDRADPAAPWIFDGTLMDRDELDHFKEWRDE